MKSFPQTARYKPITQYGCTLQQMSSFREVSHESKHVQNKLWLYKPWNRSFLVW